MAITTARVVEALGISGRQDPRAAVYHRRALLASTLAVWLEPQIHLLGGEL
jgi:hypothetical protein